MNIVLIIVSVAVGLIVLLKVWNKYSLKYNHGILRNSECGNCGNILKEESLIDAITKLDKEKEQMRKDAKLGTVKLHNMELICANCGAVNFERDLYKANSKKKK